MKKSDALDIETTLLSAAFTNHDLCTRCGTCIGVCPEEALVRDERGFPQLVPGKCTGTGICRDICPGAELSFSRMAEDVFGCQPNDSGFDGHVIGTRMAHSTDEGIRGAGAGGGVVTALLWDMLQSGEVDGCVVTRMRPDMPWLGEPFVARNYEDLRSSQGSKYLVIPVNTILQEIRRHEGKFAVAALPCQVHGLRRAMVREPWVKEKIVALVGLFCGGALEPEVVTDMLRTKGLKKEDIQGFQFRGGDWPGKIRAIKKDGTIRDMHYSNYKEGAYNYFIGLYMPMRCQTCLDGSNLFADCAVSDAWTKNEYGEYKFKSCSRVLIRTSRGQEIVKEAAQRGSINLIDLERDANYKTQRLQTRRKGITAPLRVQRLAAKGLPVPRYDLEAPEATWKERLSELAVTSLLRNARGLHFRYPLIKFLTSSGAIPLIHLRLWLKNRKYKKRPRPR